MSELRIRFIASIGINASGLSNREIELLEAGSDLTVIAGSDGLSSCDLEHLATLFRRPVVFVPGQAEAARWRDDRERDRFANHITIISARQNNFRYLDDMELSLTAYGGPAIRLIGSPCIARSAYVPPSRKKPFAAIDAILWPDDDLGVKESGQRIRHRQPSLSTTRFDSTWLGQRLSIVSGEPCIVCTTGLPLSSAQFVARSRAAPLALLMGGEDVTRVFRTGTLDVILNDQFGRDGVRLVAFDRACTLQISTTSASSRALSSIRRTGVEVSRARRRWGRKRQRAMDDNLR